MEIYQFFCNSGKYFDISTLCKANEIFREIEKKAKLGESNFINKIVQKKNNERKTKRKFPIYNSDYWVRRCRITKGKNALNRF